MEPAFIIFGGTVFWVLAAVFFIALLLSIEYDNGWTASVLTVAMVVGLTWGVEINLFAWAWTNPASAFTYFVGYFIAGTVWAIMKWWFYCHKLLDVVKDIKVEFLNYYKISGDMIPDDKRDAFVSGVVKSHRYTDKHYPPQSMDHKSDWLMWATWWPISSFWTMLNQPIKNIWLFIYSRLGGMMQKISDRVFSEI